ncbi:MAG: homoserine O-acetyltransferase MetX, partial [Mycobacteriales bacterium]
MPLEAGGSLSDVKIAYETWGTLAPDRSNAVLVLHALTGDSHIAGPAGPGHATMGWWSGLVGAGKPLDTDHWFIVVPSALGDCQGSTGPSSTGPSGQPWGSKFPFITVRDMVAAEVALTDALGIESWAAVIGPSLGGMRALEWAVTHPDRVERLCVIAALAAASADQIAWTHLQIAAIYNDPHWRGGDYYTDSGHGPEAGLAIARGIAHLVYRAEPALSTRFGREYQELEHPWHGGRYAVESYLDYNGHKLANRY